jgi:hypothetical protein
MKINFKKLKKDKGFVILFAVTISAILLAISLSVADIAFKEVQFGTSAKDTNDAFFSADTGAEQALFNDKGGDSIYPGPGSWSFSLGGLGAGQKGCAKVSIVKTSSPTRTTIISKGYNNGGDVVGLCNPLTRSIEREIKVTYSGVSNACSGNVLTINSQNYCVQTFSNLGPATFTAPSGVNSVDLLVVAGGGGGGWAFAGGGAGGYRYVTSYSVVPGQSYNLSVGAGGGAATSNGDGNPVGANGENGGNSFFDTITAIGGGGGGGRWAGYANGDGLPPGAGGSGGGGAAAYSVGGSTHQQTGGAGTAGQGSAGGAGTFTGDSTQLAGGGGGGAGGVGGDGNAGLGGDGGYGLSNSITGTAKAYAGGGSGNGGVAYHGGGDSIYPPTPGTGGGGGPGNYGASGVVIARYLIPSAASQ